jgi:sialic acid synthase SpsE
VEVAGFGRLVANIRDIEKALGDGVKRVSATEVRAMAKLRRVGGATPSLAPPEATAARGAA